MNGVGEEKKSGQKGQRRNKEENQTKHQNHITNKTYTRKQTTPDGVGEKKKSRVAEKAREEIKKREKHEGRGATAYEFNLVNK